MHHLLILENSKIYIKTYIKIAPTCFGPRPSSGSLHLSLAKVTLMLKQLVKLRHYVLCSGAAACYVQVWCACTVCFVYLISFYHMLLYMSVPSSQISNSVHVYRVIKKMDSILYVYIS
jgi:hypothetical protein